MNYNKLFFPIGGGDELESRINGALLIAKKLNAHVEIFQSIAKPSEIMQFDENLPETLLKELNAVAHNRLEESLHIHQNLVKTLAEEIGVSISEKALDNEARASFIARNGYRSKLIEEESKFCDLVIAASPPNGNITATFETTITKSGKPVLMFPRVMKSFKNEKILIGWNNSAEASRALTQSIPLLKNAKEVHIVTSIEYIKNSNQMEKLQDYLLCHGIKSTSNIIETTRIPGQALLNHANEGNFDIIVAGAFGRKGLKELMFGGATKYILEHTTIPIFMAH